MSEPGVQYFDLSHFGLVRISGADADGFLQNQITADIYRLNDQGWLLAAWCLPNGRIVSDFILFPVRDHFMLVLPSMLKDKIINKLRMYILRSKVIIEDASDDYAIIGLQGPHIDNVLQDINLSLKNESLFSFDGISVINYRETIPRIMMVMEMEKLGSRMNRIFMACKEGDRSGWSLLDIKAGLPWVTDPTSEKFLPQMLNLDQAGGLSFEKGCYPGQEVIARLHYRGEVKQRLYLGAGTGEATPGPGDDLEYAESGRLFGSIVDAEPDPAGGFAFLAVADVKLEQQAEKRLRGSESAITGLQSLLKS